MREQTTAAVVGRKTVQIIRIDHECEGGIEKSIPRITDWHHGACRVMTNGDHEGPIFSIPPSHDEWILFLAHH